MSRKQPSTDRATARLAPYYVAMSLTLGALASVVTLLAELRDEFGLSETQLGLIVGAGFLTAFITQLTLGRFADRGFAPLMVRTGMAAAGVATFAFAFGSSFWIFVAARGALGVAIGLAQPAIRRTVVLADPEHSGRNLGRLAIAEVLGFALMPFIAAMLAEFGSLRTPFVVVGLVMLLTTVGLGRLAPDDGDRSTGSNNPLSLLRERAVVAMLLIVASQFVLIGSWEAVWSVTLSDLGASTSTIGLSFSLFAIPLVILAPLAGSVAQRSGGGWLAAAGLGASSIASVLLGVIDSVGGLLLMSLAVSAGSGLGYPSGLYAFAQAVGEARQATAHGLLGATEVLLGGLAAVTAAWLYDSSGRGAVWVMAAGVSLGCVLIGGVLGLGAGRPDDDAPVSAGSEADPPSP